MISDKLLQTALPLAIEWAEQQEQKILQEGVPLTATTLADAKRIGVLHPGKVR